MTTDVTDADDTAWVVAVAIVRERPSQPSAGAPPGRPSEPYR